MMDPRPTQRRRSQTTLLLVGATLVASLALTGCFSSATDPENTVTTAVADEVTLDEIIGKAQLDEEQAAALAPILEAWRAQKRAGNTEPMGALNMLADAAEVLDSSQMVALLELLDEKRQAALAQGQGQRGGRGGPGAIGDRQRQPGSQGGPRGRGGRGGRGPRGPRGGGDQGPALLEQLGLDEAQQAAVQAAREEMHTAAKALFEQYRAGSITKEELKAAMQPLRETMWSQIEAALTAEQLAQLETLRNAKVLQHLEKALANIQENGAARLELIARILELDEQQIASATTLHEEGVAALSTLVESLRSGNVSGEEARAAAADLRSQGRDDFRALLTPAQQEVFDALKSLEKRGHKRRGPR